MKNYKNILLVCILLLSGEFLFAQDNQKDTEILFSLQNSDLIINIDTLYFLKEEGSSLYFFDNKVYNNKKYIYIFKNVEYYMELIFLKRNENYYLYIYPKYQNRTGPYIWYGLGTMLEITKNNIIIKSGYDYYDSLEIDRIFGNHNFKVIRKLKLEKLLKSNNNI